ncbi:NAD(P)H-binding protein [Hydrotalea sp.]|uniref:NAD(P)H-binding protein n=1 Tax=Hydrotalea sp. TaxID=2881279 RepID=UPI003D0FEB34
MQQNSSNPIRVIITGATGMVGEGVLHECLQSEQVASILVINRRQIGLQHPKLTEVIHQDFMDVGVLASVVKGYDACFFCLGVSSVGMKEATYNQLTYTLTTGFARLLCEQNPNMVFCYVSGKGTDSSEKGVLMWARVKGKTENALLQMPFKAAYMFRPGIIIPTPGLKNTLKLYHYLGWLIPLFKLMMPNSICSLQQIGKAMIRLVAHADAKRIIEVNDIKRVAATE